MSSLNMPYLIVFLYNYRILRYKNYMCKRFFVILLFIFFSASVVACNTVESIIDAAIEDVSGDTDEGSDDTTDTTTSEDFSGDTETSTS